MGLTVRIRFPPAVSQANFRIAQLARPDLVERQPELLALLALYEACLLDIDRMRSAGGPDEDDYELAYPAQGASFGPYPHPQSTISMRSDLRGLPSKIAWASIRAVGLGENPHSS